ncbi:MAG TPA: hypothetical protein VL307_10875, partial [Chitinophagaceae bacterium]|nr:hypothetical protein [Chitinophagaceae bacterium]
MRQRLSNAYSWYANNVLKILYFTLSVTLLVVVLERVGIIFSYEGHTAGIDNNFDYGIIRAIAGYSLYPDPSNYPFAVNPYAPLFFLTCKWIANLLHIQADNTLAVYRLSRTVALLADIGTWLLLYALLRKRLKVKKELCIAGIATFICILSFLGYTINRCDALFLFFYASAIFILSRPDGKRMLLSALLLAIVTTLCIFSKQNGIVLIGLVTVWRAMERKFFPAFLYLLFLATFCSAFFLLFNNYYTDHFFAAHVINSLKNRIDFQWFYVYVFKLIAGSYIGLPLAVAGVMALSGIVGRKNGMVSKLSAIFLIQFIASTLLCLKWGSSLGYFNESFFLATLLIAAYCKSIDPTRLESFLKTALPYLYPCLAIFVLHMLSQLFFFFLNSQTIAKQHFEEQVQISQYIKQQIGGSNRYVIDLSNADFNFFKALLYKEEAAPNIDAVNCCTLPDKIFDYSRLLQGLRDGSVQFLIKANDSQLQNLWGVDIHHFVAQKQFSNYTVY